MASNFGEKRSRRRNSISDDETEETTKRWKRAFRIFLNHRREKLAMKRTVLVHWEDLSEGFLVRETEEIVSRALEGEGMMYYSGDMFDSWFYFSPVERRDEGWYKKNTDTDLLIDENVMTDIHHLTMAFKTAQLEELPESSERMQNLQAGSPCLISQTEESIVCPSDIAKFYWEARAQGFQDLRGKLFTVSLLRMLFTGIDNVNVTYSTTGPDSFLDRSGYILKGPTEEQSCDSADQFKLNTELSSKEKYKMLLKNQNTVAFDLKETSQKVTPDVSVTIGNYLVLIADVASFCELESRKIQELHLKMLLSLNKCGTLFGLLVQRHQVYVVEYTYEHESGYRRCVSQTAFKYTKKDIELLYCYLQKQVIEKWCDKN
ncbi:uncharacterized protein LOC133175777 [Saccostrea echinata]|uniref:uncharacterized protein LOC133175777 n=1 Tax=Saccostrea echinata TaxID=191078 RepID=UPI002A815941|nr:uncharacterized protein LOC133175777 [Saccostrea echinata]